MLAAAVIEWRSSDQTTIDPILMAMVSTSALCPNRADDTSN